MRKDDCVFCQIIDKKVPSKVIYEDDYVLAFLDIDPVAEGHTLIIPKSHADTILDIEDNTLAKIAEASKKITKKIFEVLHADGVNILQNNKEAASQIIGHYHMHVIPRKTDDGFKILNVQARQDIDLFAMLDETLGKIKLN